MTDKEYIQKLEQENATLRREVRLVKLRRQVTPHFLFNSLSVSMSLITKDSKMAMKFLRHVAAMYRYLLSFGNEYHVPIEQELKMLHQYYELMSIRHVGSIVLEESPDVQRLKGHPLPPLAMQGLLENAIKHNAHSPDHPLKIMLTVEEGYLCVRNNLSPLVSPASSTKMGLAYMNDTMKLMFDREIKIEKDDASFTVKLPLI